MNEKEKKGISKYLSYVLRHHPESVHLTLDSNGWVSVAALIEQSKLKNIQLTKAMLKEIVETNDKKRFAFNEDHSKIRANQGHSVQNIDLGLTEVEPPETLYHGTVARFLEAIRAEGLIKGNRQHVHLSADKKTAINVGSRRGKAVVLEVKAAEMYQQGYVFYLSENGVWLTEQVPEKFIE